MGIRQEGDTHRCSAATASWACVISALMLARELRASSEVKMEGTTGAVQGSERGCTEGGRKERRGKT